MKSALKIEMQFLFEKAKSCKKTHHTQRPDIDNLEKAVLDGLNKVAFEDDAQIVEIHSVKDFRKHNKIVILITELE